MCNVSTKFQGSDSLSKGQLPLSFVSLHVGKNKFINTFGYPRLLYVTLLTVKVQTGIRVYTSVSSVLGNVNYFWKPDKTYMKSWDMIFMTTLLLICDACGKNIRVKTEIWLLNITYPSIVYSECLLHAWYLARRYVRYKICKTKPLQVGSPG